MSNKMWGGRFSERPDEIMEEINVSIDVQGPRRDAGHAGHHHGL
jgi:argininosuccinate lyase